MEGGGVRVDDGRAGEERAYERKGEEVNKSDKLGYQTFLKVKKIS